MKDYIVSSLIFVSTFWSALVIFANPAFANPKAPEGKSYQKQTVEVVKARRSTVEMSCDNNDELIDGTCSSSSPLANYFESLPEIEINTFKTARQGKPLFVCRAKLLGRVQVARVTTSITCKKSLETATNLPAQATLPRL